MKTGFIHYIKQVPFVRLCIPLILGIIFQIVSKYEHRFTLVIILILSVLFILINKSISKTGKAYILRYIPGLLIFVLLFLVGVLLTKIRETHPLQYINTDVTASSIVSEPIDEKKKTYKTTLNIEIINSESGSKVLKERIIAYFTKSEKSAKIKYGDKIIFKKQIREISNSGNPNEFDYVKYMTRKGISGQIFLNDEDWQISSHNNGNLIYHYAYKLRDNLKLIYLRKDFADQDLAVLQALTLGDKSDISPETKKSFVSSGAMHILAVSGLHIGILYILFNFFLKVLDKFKIKDIYIGKTIKAIVLIFLLWAFALLSGLSPSVSRAALMFSFVIIGKSMKRQINIYNSITASAFVLLIIDPYQITNVGFQLSYSAVLAIVFFQPKIAQLFVIKNKVLWYIWSLTAVSIAAQIGTFPLSLYYFNIFPNFFILTNIVVIPMVTLILYTAFLMIATSFIPIISEFFALILHYLVKGLNLSVSFIDQIPYSFTKNIRFFESDVLFAYLLIISLSIFLLLKRSNSLNFSLSIIILWISYGIINKVFIEPSDHLVIYNIKDETTINIISEKNYLLGNQSLESGQKIKYGPLPYWLLLGKPEYDFHNLDSSEIKNKTFIKKGNLIRAGNLYILNINNANIKNYINKTKPEIDIILISENANITIQEIKDRIKFKIIIFDSSNNYYKIRNWEKQCKELNISFHSTDLHGAFLTGLRNVRLSYFKTHH